MKKNKWIKVIGFTATIIGFGMSLVSDWADGKSMSEEIKEQINEELAKRLKESR